jgi:hypothetical protein
MVKIDELLLLSLHRVLLLVPHAPEFSQHLFLLHGPLTLLVVQLVLHLFNVTSNLLVFLLEEFLVLRDQGVFGYFKAALTFFCYELVDDFVGSGGLTAVQDLGRGGDMQTLRGVHPLSTGSGGCLPAGHSSALAPPGPPMRLLLFLLTHHILLLHYHLGPVLPT